MKVKHGYRYVSMISKEKADLLREEWSVYAVSSANEKDRAENITYEFQEVGKITISHSNGAMTIFTNCNTDNIEEFMDKWLTDNDKQVFKENIRCTEFGVHSPKSHVTLPIMIETKEALEFPVWISMRRCNNYTDIHVKMVTDKADIKFPSNKEVGSSNASSRPKRHYYSDKEILDFVKRKGSVKTSDCKELGIDKSTFYRRLEKISKKHQEVERTSVYPAIYSFIEA